MSPTTSWAGKPPARFPLSARFLLFILSLPASPSPKYSLSDMSSARSDVIERSPEAIWVPQVPVYVVVST